MLSSLDCHVFLSQCRPWEWLDQFRSTFGDIEGIGGSVEEKAEAARSGPFLVV